MLRQLSACRHSGILRTSTSRGFHAASSLLTHTLDTRVDTNDGPVREYKRMVRDGRLIDDAFQRSILFGAKDPERVTAPRGLYIYGDVGTGKTTTMDMFYASIPTTHKRRVHFHSFMLEVHARINHFRRTHSAHEDPVPTLARELARASRVVCFDEFQVTDIADAMVLRRLLHEMFMCGVVMVTTSNRHPDALYANGIQRESFMPCIDELKRRCECVSLDSGTDYRKLARESAQVFFAPITRDTNSAVSAVFARASQNAQWEINGELRFLGRSLCVPRSARGVAWFEFANLCTQAHGSADYIELARHFHTLVLTNVPVMHMDDRNAARRFITLIDALYEAHVVLIMSCEAEISDLFTGEFCGEKEKGCVGEEEVFAFQRAVSRLVEMQSTKWIVSGRNDVLAENARRQHVDSAKQASEDQVLATN
ncbi:ATPase [Coemansia sp. RSA 720]|nr:ATPase [Coemansia sp. RSA 638]KAJ2122189.1 ATPase [Coemansia sp. RSA 720]KAJ2540843.1 ATPase [Coemansia sp. RSA 1853]